MNNEAITILVSVPIFTIVGAVIFNFSIKTAIKSLLATRWPSVKGEIKGVKIGDSIEDESIYYETIVTYRYTIDGLTYNSNTMAYGILAWSHFWLTSGAVLESIKSYPNINVRYNPNNPGEATIITGLRRFHIANFIFSFAWLSLCFYGLKIGYIKYYKEYVDLLNFLAGN